jgi:hypothetical protein
VLCYYGIITHSFHLGTDWLLVATDTPRTPEDGRNPLGVAQQYKHFFTLCVFQVFIFSVCQSFFLVLYIYQTAQNSLVVPLAYLCVSFVFNDVVPTAIFILSQCLAYDLMD